MNRDAAALRVILALAIAAALLPLFAIAITFRFFQTWQAAIAVAGVVALGAAPHLYAWRARLGDALGATSRLEGGALWAGCAVALLLVFLAVEVSSQTMSLTLIAQAQANHLPYVVGQPLAAAIFAAAAAAALDDDAIAAVGLAPAPARAAQAACLVAMSALGAMLFAAGFAGPLLSGPVWLLVKTAASLAVIVLIRRRVAALTPAGRAALVWRALVPAGLANLVATFLVVGL